MANIGKVASDGTVGYLAYGLVNVVSREANPPSPKRVITEIPHSNNVIDQTSIGGHVYYERRRLKYVLDVNSSNRDMTNLKTVTDWLYGFQGCGLYENGFGSNMNLTFSDVWLESCQVDEKGNGRNGYRLSVEFSAYPWPKANGSEVHV